MTAEPVITLQDALAQLQREGDPDRAAGTAAAEKTQRPCLGIPLPRLADLAKAWRADLSLDARLALAEGLWQSDIHEARLLAAKLLVQARIRPDDAAWQLIAGWSADLDGPAIADQLADAGAKRLVADPARLEELEAWTRSANMWQRRAVLTFTAPWAKMNNLKPADTAARERILTWAAAAVADRDWHIQKAVGSWLRDLSKHDAGRARDFLDGPGLGLKSFARKLAQSWLD